jgi:Leucine-rich repeat (LRR) protein
MGGHFSHAITEAKDNGGSTLVIENHESIKSKEMTELLKVLQSSLPELNSLSVNRCKVKKLPKEIGKLLLPLQKLTVLQLEHNQIEALPPSLAELNDTLVELSLFNNRFSNFPGALIEKLALQSLDFGRNQLNSLEGLVNPASLKILKTMLLQQNLFSTFPASLCSMTSLQKLDLGNNSISTIPDALSNLGQLKELYLKVNDFIKTTSLSSSQTN